MNVQTTGKIPNILIVDDLPGNLKVLADILLNEGYRILQVSNGVRALRIAESEKPDLILLDILMPEMDGFEVCRRLKQNALLKEIPVIFISALNDIKNIIQAFTAGGVDYINKPFQKEEVKARVKTHLKIHHQNEELQKLIAERDKFFSIIAHDLRGPIGMLMQLTELLADKELGLPADRVSEMIDDMNKSARNTFNLLENLLEWSQISRGLTEANPQRMSLNKVATDCINLLNEQARGKGIELVDKITNETEVIAEKNMLQSVIRNLLSNAIKFTRKGGKITISAKTAENNQILVSVEDTGIGMTEDLRNNLFRIEENTKRAGTQGELSTGLGLLLCKEFVEKQGGRISVESEENVGSVFSFTIPLAFSSPKKNEIEKVVSDDSQKRPLRNLNILIAEDDEITAKIFSIMLKGISNQLFRAKSGDEAVEICRSHPEIDLVIMDIKMPLMNGFEATRQIRQFNPNLVILAESTFTMPSDREMAIEAGCNDYLLKPFTWEVFEGMIQQYVRK
jgi:two-component system, sensor histidine kinase and response regulator